MALETLTYGALSERYRSREQACLGRIRANERKALIEFEKRTQDPEVYRRLQKSSNSARWRIEEVLSPEWAEIRIGAEEAVMKQLALYNKLHTTPGAANPWCERFQFLSQLPQEKQQLAAKNMHSSKSERLLRAFSKPDFYPVPRNGSPVSTVPLDACIVMPDRIPDELAEKLGIAAFEPTDSPMERLHKKESLECTTSLKEILEQSHPLSQGNYRILVLPDGRLLYTSGNGEYDSPGSPLEARVYDAYGALRKTHHEPRLYDQEIAKLERIAEEIRLLIHKLNTEWKAHTPQAAKQALMAEAAQLSQQWTREFDACRNPYKVEARELMTVAQSLTDRSGKINPSAAMSKYVAATNRMRKRCEQDIADKGSYNYKDQAQLQAQINRHENRMRSFRRWVQDHADTVSLREELRSAPSLQGIALQPFRLYAETLQEKMGVLDAALGDGDPQAVRALFIRMHIIGKCQGLRSCLASIQQDIIDPQGALLSEIRAKLIRFTEYFSARQIAAGATVPELELPFQEMQQRCEALMELLGESDAPDRRVGRGDPLLRALKQFMKELNEAQMKIVRELP